MLPHPLAQELRLQAALPESFRWSKPDGPHGWVAEKRRAGVCDQGWLTSWCRWRQGRCSCQEAGDSDVFCCHITAVTAVFCSVRTEYVRKRHRAGGIERTL